MISKAGEEPRRPFPKVVALLVLASAPFLCFVLIAQGTPTKIASLICGVSAAFAMLTFVYVRLRANRRGEKRQRFVASEEGRAKMRTLLQSRGFNSKEDIVAIFPDKAGSSLVVGSLLRCLLGLASEITAAASSDCFGGDNANTACPS